MIVHVVDASSEESKQSLFTHWIPFYRVVIPSVPSFLLHYASTPVLVVANKVDLLLAEEKEGLMSYFNRALSLYIVRFALPLEQ